MKNIPREVLMYRRDRSFESQLNKIPSWDANEEDKQIVKKFIKNLGAQSLTYGRKEKYLFYLRRICEWTKKLGFDFKTAIQDDIINLASEINNSDYSHDTKSGFKITIKRLYLETLEKEKAELIDWMYSRRCRALRNGINKSEEKIEKAPYTREDIAKIINQADVLMKAVISVAFEGCLRPAEYILAEYSQLKSEGNSYELQVVGKTGKRYIYLVDSLPYIKEWLEVKSNGKYLFCDSKGNFLKEKILDREFKALCEKAKIDTNKPRYLYWLRHSGITYKRILGFSDELIIRYAGWTSGKQLKTYSHVTREYKSEILKKAGLEPDEQKIKAIKICPKCGSNQIGFSEEYCPKCHTTLDAEKYHKQLERQGIYEKLIERLVEVIDIDKLVNDDQAVELLKILKR